MLTNKEYLESGGYSCPNCARYDLKGVEPLDHNDTSITQRVRCGNCQAEFRDRFVLVGYQELSVPGSDEVHHPPDPRPEVVIEVRGGGADVVECPDWISVEIVDFDSEPEWRDLTRRHLAGRSDSELNDLALHAQTMLGTSNSAHALSLLKLIRDEHARRVKEAESDA